MKTLLSSRKHDYVARFSIFLITVALIAGMVGCGGGDGGGESYTLAIASTAGGWVTTPGEGAFTYDEGEVVNLVAEAEEGYQFVNWTGDVGTIANVEAATTAITMDGDYSIVANFTVEIWEIRDWYDLDAVRNNLGGSYILMNDLDSNTAGYEELASDTANQGHGWEPIGTGAEPFTGVFRGQGYEMKDLFIDRPDQDYVGLFGCVGAGGVIEQVGAVNAVVTGDGYVGGLVGYHGYGIVSNSYSTSGVTGNWHVGGLVGQNGGTVSDSYSASSVTGRNEVGGLVGDNNGTVSNSYSRGNVTAEWEFGGLVGVNGWYGGQGIVSNSHYCYDEVLINGKNVITIGALCNEDFAQWLANDKFLDVNERLSQEDGYYVIDDVSDFKQLLAFGQDDSLKFRLKADLDLATEPNFYIPYLAAEFHGNGHKIRNLNFNLFLSRVGLFGYIASSGKVSEVRVETVNISGRRAVGGLSGWNGGTVSNSYSSGSVTASSGSVGGLVGVNDGTVSNSYSTAGVTGQGWIGSLVGENNGAVSNSYYSYDEVLINGRNMITIGALFNEDFEQWLANDKFLDVNERLSQEGGYYLINDVRDFKQLLAFGQDGSLRFRLQNDLDLGDEFNFYIPYLAGEFDGNSHRISDLNFSFDFVSQVGLFGYLASGAKVTGVGVENANIAGCQFLGGLVGWNEGTVSKSCSTGSVIGESCIGGLVGWNGGTVSNSCSTGSVTGESWVGGLVGQNQNYEGTVSDSYSTSSVTGVQIVGGLLGSNGGTISNSYSIGSVTGQKYVGGLVRSNYGGTVTNSFWDTPTSGQATSAGGTGKTTAEMKDIATFSGAAWNISAVAHEETNPAYTWNIVDGQTYPFLSWQSVS